MSIFTIIGNTLEIMIADSPLFIRSSPSSIPGARGELGIGAGEKFAFCFYEFVLDVPVTSYPKVHVCERRFVSGERREREAS
jgi:hypothetical protein